jgi:hypothetical protein
MTFNLRILARLLTLAGGLPDFVAPIKKGPRQQIALKPICAKPCGV